MIKKLKNDYTQKKDQIKKRLKDFKKVFSEKDDKIFSELCFCICTPQSKAVYCDKAITGLVKSGMLFSGSEAKIREGLKAVRFPNNKAKYITETRRLFTSSGKIKIKEKIDASRIIDTRNWLVGNVKGIGYKEASHFLRNIGLGEDLAILDVHILKNMLRFGVLSELPKTITKRKYLILEEKLRGFSEEVNIPMGELDLLFWSGETGVIFK